MNTERDKFLTEAMGECWHEWKDSGRACPQDFCAKCGVGSWIDVVNHNFSTWAGFGKLWEWAQMQEWWTIKSPFWAGYTSYKDQGRYKIGDAFINPDRFADAVYNFLKDRP